MAIADLRDHYDAVHLMAGSLSFATPRELCGLRALVDHAALHADTVYFDCPVATDVHRYLERMSFYDNLPLNVILSQSRPSVRTNDQAWRLIEVRRIDCVDAVENFWRREYGRSLSANWTRPACNGMRDGAGCRRRERAGSCEQSDRCPCRCAAIQTHGPRIGRRGSGSRDSLHADSYTPRIPASPTSTPCNVHSKTR